MGSGDGSGETSRFKQLDDQTLSNIFGYCTAETLASLSLVNQQCRVVAEQQASWRTAFEVEFPYYWRTGNALRSSARQWRTEFRDRRLTDANWRTGQLSQPCTEMRGFQGNFITLEALKDPFPSGMVIVGGLDDPDHELTDIASQGRVNMYNTSLELPAVGRLGYNLYSHVPDLDPFVSVFCVHQRPNKSEIVVNQAGNEPSIIIEVQPIPHNHYQAAADSQQTKELDEAADRSAFMVKNTNLKSLNRFSSQEVDTAGLASELLEQGAPPAYHHIVKYKLKGHAAPCAKAQCREETVFTASFDGGVRVYQPPPLPPMEMLPGSSTEVPEPKDVAPVVTLFDEHERAEGQQPSPVIGLDVTDDCSKLASGGHDMQIKLWDVATQKLVLRMPGHQGWIWTVEAIDNEQLTVFASAGTEGALTVWDTRVGGMVGSASIPGQFGGDALPISSFKFRPDKNFAAFGCLDHKVYILDRRTMRYAPPLTGHPDRATGVDIIGDTVISTGFAGVVRMWDFKS